MRLTVSETAELLEATEERVFGWIESDALPAQRVRGEYRINRTELLEWATSHRVTVAPAAFVQAVSGGIPSVPDALRVGGVHHGLAVRDAATAVRAIVEMLPLAADGDRETLLQFVLARDSFGLAVVDDAVAIPQVRTPAVLPITSSYRSLLSLSFLTHPLMLPAEERPRVVEAIFFLVSPTVTAHLALLAKLTACLSDDDFRGVIKRQRTQDEILRAAADAEARL